MGYTPTVYVDNSTPALSATNLNHLEQGVAAAGIAAGVPSRAGSTAGAYDPSKYLYNANAGNMRAFREVMGIVLAGGLSRIRFIGDSKIAGYEGSTTIAASKSTPAVLGNLLAARGIPSAGSGFVLASSGASSTDARWSNLTGWTFPNAGANPGATQLTALAANTMLTYTSTETGTEVDIYTLDITAPFQYRIDGGSWTTFTGGGTNVWRIITVSGLANTTHVIDIESTTATATYVSGVSVHGSAGLLIDNWGVCGSRSTDWSSNVAWYYMLNQLAYLSAPHCNFISLGTNDAAGAVTIPTFTTAMSAVITQEQTAGRPCAIIVPTSSQVSTITAATWSTYVAAMYDLADSFNLPLIDLTDQSVTWELANAAGLRTNSEHENNAGYAQNALAIMRFLLG